MKSHTADRSAASDPPPEAASAQNVGNHGLLSLIRQFLRFAVVGIIAFIIDYGLLVLLTEAFGVHYLISATISFTVSLVFNYFASMRYVFTRRSDMSRHREFIIFVVLSVIGLALNDVLLYVGTDLIGITYFVTKILAGVIVALWNFFSRRRFLDVAGAVGLGLGIGGVEKVVGADVAEDAEGPAIDARNADEAGSDQGER